MLFSDVEFETFSFVSLMVATPSHRNTKSLGRTVVTSHGQSLALDQT